MENQSLTFLNFAKHYLKIGWSLLPMKFIDDGTGTGKMKKQPMVRWKPYQDRQPTEEEVIGWLKNGWFLGVITGKISGIVIIDDDRIKHGLEPTTLKSTIIAKTKSGGMHYYYRYDRPISNHANSDLFVDIRGDGGYCVMPPFNEYTWISPPSEDNLKNLPILSSKAELEIIGERRINSGKIILADFEIIHEGERNSTIHKLACHTWNNNQLTEAEKISQIRWLNETRCLDKNNKPNPLSENELQVIINQARNFVTNNPKTGKVDEIIVPARGIQSVIDSRIAERELEKDCPSTGFSLLDNMVKGFVPKHTYILTGDTNVGKTSLACFFASAVASQNKKVLYLALEPDTSVVEYLASIVNNKKFIDLVEEDYKILSNLPIKFYFKSDIDTVDKLIKAIDTDNKYDLIIIDHIGYFVTDKLNTNQEQSNVVKKLAQIATERKVAVMAIAHLRKPDGRGKPRIPTMNDISGSGAFKQDGTDVWIVYKEPKLEDRTRSTFSDTGFLIVAKSKSGKSGPISIRFSEGKAGIFEYDDTPKPLRHVDQIPERELKEFEQQLFNGLNTTLDTNKQR